MAPTEPRSVLELRPAEPGDLSALAEVFLASRGAAAMPPVADPADARRWISSWDLAVRQVWLAHDDAGLAGFAAVEGDWLESLYVAPDRQRAGVGSTLFETVAGLRPDGFGLWVFESNAPARAFYARHGCVELEHTDGSTTMERSPDVHVVWPGAEPLAHLRGLIDGVDRDLADVLSRRAAITAAVQDLKDVGGHAGRDPEREREIAERMVAHAPGLSADAVRRIVHVVIEESLAAWERRG